MSCFDSLIPMHFQVQPNQPLSRSTFGSSIHWTGRYQVNSLLIWWSQTTSFHTKACWNNYLPNQCLVPYHILLSGCDKFAGNLVFLSAFHSNPSESWVLHDPILKVACHFLQISLQDKLCKKERRNVSLG